MSKPAPPTGDTQEKQPPVQWPFAALALAPLLLLRIMLISEFGHAFSYGRSSDFIAYWAAGRLFLTGLHPYSAAQILRIEQAISSNFSHPQFMLYPPWTLPIFALLGSTSFYVAHRIWFGLSMMLDLLSAAGLWIYFGGSRSRLWIPLLIVATFLQMGATELVGQITPLILISLTAFLLLTRHNRNFLAGLCLVAFGIKPQLLYLVFLAILWWTLRQRRWAILAGALLISSTLLLIAGIYNPNSLDYFSQSYPHAISYVCGLGGILRTVFGIQHTWLQFVPTVFGIIWFLWYAYQHRAQWNWERDIPILTLVSVSTAAYGWYHDFILVLPAIIAVAARGAYRSAVALVCYLALQIAMLLAGGISFAWMFAAGLLWIPFYLYFNQSQSGQTAEQSLAPQA